MDRVYPYSVSYTHLLREGDHVKVYVVDVREGEKGPRALVSRTHPGLVKRLFEMEVPEIFNGVVEIKAVSREAGSRTKLAVLAHDENVDAVGACIGPRGARVGGIVDEQMCIRDRYYGHALRHFHCPHG